MLLDTHALLWFVLDDKKLSPKAMASIRDGTNELHLSPASYWEIAIKISIGKYELDMPYDEFWNQAIFVNRINVLPIEVRHTSQLVSLPFHHKDPFDRLLIAQCLAEKIRLVSGDKNLDAYGVHRIW